MASGLDRGGRGDRGRDRGADGSRFAHGLGDRLGFGRSLRNEPGPDPCLGVDERLALELGASGRSRLAVRLERLLHRDDRDLDHVVGGLSGRDLLDPHARQHDRMDERVGPVPRAQAEQLVADRRDDRDEQDPAADHDQRRLPPDQREHHDRQGDDHDEELGAAALVGGRVLADRVGRERVAGLERVDRHVLGAVVLEDAPDVRGPGDEREIAEEDRDPDEALDEVLDEAVVDLARGERGDEQREQEEDPDAGDRGHEEHQRDRALAQLHALLARGERRRSDEPAGAHDQRLVQDDEPAHERQPCPAAAVEPGVEPLGRPDDAALGAAKCDRDRIATAHEHALDQGLTAVGVTGHPGSLPARPRITGNRDGGPGRPAIGVCFETCADQAPPSKPRLGRSAPGASGSARPGRRCR